MKKYGWTKSIKYMISIPFTIIAVIAMGVTGSMLYARYVTSTQNLIIENNKQMMNQVSLNLDSYVRNMMRVSDSMYYSVIKNVDLAVQSMDKEMNLLYEANKDNLISIACFTEEGELVGAAPVAAMKKGVDASAQGWFGTANDKIENFHFSTPHVQNLFEDSTIRYYWVISLSRVVELTGNGEIRRGVLLVDMNFSGIEQMFNKVNSGGQGYAYLIDGNGEFIYHPKQKAIYSNLINENNLEAAKYEDGNHMERFEGVERSVTVKTVGYTGWKIVSVIPTSEFSVNLSEMRFFVVIVVAISILIITFINFFISKQIATPIQKLEESVKKLEEGNLNPDIYIGGSHEVQHLGKTIKSMMLQMRKLMDEIVVEQEEKRKTELDALQSQINPHFLYNTLDSIVWMVESERHREAISMVTALANLFRISLSKGKTIITVREEMEHAINYMNIQKVRYKNRFTFQTEVDPSIKECSTIKLIIQPILENSIYYGMEFMDGDGEILVKGYTENEDIFIEVTDNGPGMTRETVDLLLTDGNRVHKKGSGVGLRNVHQRIRLYFGANYGLEIESEPDEGTRVRIHLPRSFAQDEGDRG